MSHTTGQEPGAAGGPAHAGVPDHAAADGSSPGAPASGGLPAQGVAEGPVVDRRPVVPVGLTLGVVAVALLIAVAAAAPPLFLTLVLGLCVGIVAWGWAGTLGLPTPRGTVGVIVVGGLALVISVAARESVPWLGWVPAALAISMVAAFIHQLFRRDGRPRVVESVSSVVLALALIACGVLLVPLARTPEGFALILGALAAAAASAVSDLAGRSDAVRPFLTPLALLAGGGAASLVAVLLNGPVTTWLVLGVASAALSHALRSILVPLPSSTHPRPRLVTATVSVLVVGLVPFLVARAFLPEALTG